MPIKNIPKAYKIYINSIEIMKALELNLELFFPVLKIYRLN